MFATYETDEELSAYLHFHYGSPAAGLPAVLGWPAPENFHATIVRDLVRAPAPGATPTRALDLGCAVGRAAFELSRHFDAVTGIDLSERFIAAARQLATAGRMEIALRTLGVETELLEATVPAGSRPERVQFRTGNACLRDALPTGHDCVVALNLICRVDRPRLLLSHFPGLVKAGGQLVLATPWSWDEKITPRAEWLSAAGRETFGLLRAELEPWFTLEERRDVPFLLRETKRKFAWSIPEVTAWRRTAAP